MSAVFIARAIGLISVSMILGTLIVGRLPDLSEDAAGREWRRRLTWTGRLFAAPLSIAALVVFLSGGFVGRGGLAIIAHVVATALWVGLLLSLFLLPGPKTSNRADLTRSVTAQSARSATALALTFAAVAAASIALLVWTVPGGAPALAGTRYGRLLLAQAVLVAFALVPVTSMTVSQNRRRQRPACPASVVPPLGVLGPAGLLALASVVLSAALVGFPVSGAEPIAWPFPYRFAPGITWNSPIERSRAIVGIGILLAGLLSLVAAARLRSVRPLLLAAGILFSAAGAHLALIALSIDAYPTTYAHPSDPATPESIRRGRELFLANCAVCHGADGRGDGPAAARLLQRPADLTLPHTVDHTPGDIFWWVTHGLGLAMPPFGDHLSVDERWDVVNFVRTLGKPLPPRASGRILGSVS